MRDLPLKPAGLAADLSRLCEYPIFMDCRIDFLISTQGLHLRLVRRLLGALTDGPAVLAHRFLSAEGVQWVTGAQRPVSVEMSADWRTDPLSLRIQPWEAGRSFALGQLVGLTFGEHAVEIELARTAKLEDRVSAMAAGGAFQVNPEELVALFALSYVVYLRRRLDAQALVTLNGCLLEAGYADGGWMVDEGICFRRGF